MTAFETLTFRTLCVCIPPAQFSEWACLAAIKGELLIRRWRVPVDWLVGNSIGWEVWLTTLRLERAPLEGGTWGSRASPAPGAPAGSTGAAGTRLLLLYVEQLGVGGILCRVVKGLQTRRHINNIVYLYIYEIDDLLGEDGHTVVRPKSHRVNMSYIKTKSCLKKHRKWKEHKETQVCRSDNILSFWTINLSNRTTYCPFEPSFCPVGQYFVSFHRHSSTVICLYTGCSIAFGRLNVNGAKRQRLLKSSFDIWQIQFLAGEPRTTR